MCLAHLEPAALDEALAALTPGSDIDLRGTPITHELLGRLLRYLTPNETSARPVLGYTRFDAAQFSGDTGFGRAHFSGHAEFDGARFGEHVWFTEVQFSGDAKFERVQFNRGAGFGGAQFSGDATFGGVKFGRGVGFIGAQFSGDAWFFGAQFSPDASFERAQFGQDAQFGGARFGGQAIFERAQFSGDAGFGGAQFSGHARFRGAQFGGHAGFEEARFSERAEFKGARFEGAWSGPMVCQGEFSASNVTVARSVRMQVAADRVDLAGARFMAPAVFSVRYGAVDLTDAATDSPVRITSHALPFTKDNEEPFDESGLSGDSHVSVTSLAGVDAANIVLSDVDLSRCVFSGAHHLDQIRLEGRCVFAAAPRGWTRIRARIPARRWTRRKVLAEEAAWRANPQHGALARAGWANPGAPHTPVPVPSPAQLAVLYRQLRKALEDGKDTPGAADFYYGEMEARRHDHEGTPRAERALLHAYWLLSGYALRASRALGFLAATATATFLLMMTIGLPDNQLDPQITGTVPAGGGQVTLTQSTPDPTLTLPLGRRFSAARADKAGLVVVNSVIFRSTGATLTGPGTWIEIISRIGEPVLLGFAAVAARGRVQR